MKKDEKTEAPKPLQRLRSPLALLLIALIILGVAAAGWGYWHFRQSRVDIEKSQISAPVMKLAPVAPGIIDRVLVREGDFVRRNQVVAVIGNTSLYAKADGLVIGVKNEPGSITSTADPVVRMIDPHELRVVGRVSEDKGLADLHPGQAAVFTVDAFGDKQFNGTVERISPASREGDLVFSISDKREEKEFNVYVTYDIDAHPELKNGMSARLWVYK